MRGKERERGRTFWIFWILRIREKKRRAFLEKEERKREEKMWVRKRSGFVSGRFWKTRDLELEELVSWSTSTILAFQEVQYQQVTSEG